MQHNKRAYSSVQTDKRNYIQNTEATSKRKRHKKRVLRRILLLSIVLMISIASLGTLGYFTFYRHMYSQVQTTHAKSTQQATYHSTSVDATQVAIAQHQADYNTITSTLPSLNDPLTSPDLNNWDTDTGCAFKDGMYKIDISRPGYVLPCFAKHTRFSNLAYQVHVTIAQGDAAGLAFRSNSTNAQAYLFLIRQDSSYSIYYNAGQKNRVSTLLTQGFSDLISTGSEQENILAVIARGSALSFYINGKYLVSVTDTTLSSGQIGLIANDQHDKTEVRFSQVQVWLL